MEIITATEMDIPVIHHLADRIWKKYYPEIISTEQIEYMLHTMYSEEALREQMKAGQQFYLVADGGKTMGYLAISEKGKGEYFLHKFYIEHAHHRAGLGSSVLNELLKKFSNKITLRLTVNRQNFKAINFYFKNGFTIEKVADFDIGAGYVMNDFVMIKKS